MRLDYFIVWGHGLPVFGDVVDLIAGHPSLDVLYLQKGEVKDIAAFIREVYNYEWPLVPWEHTQSKTQFLLEGPAAVGLVVVMNRDPKLRIQDNKDPKFRMPESETIKEVKTLIREKFDPNRGGAGTIKLNPSYDPNQHIVHASDFDSQVPGILKVWGSAAKSFQSLNDWAGVAGFLWYWKTKFEPSVSTNRPQSSWKVEKVSIDKIRLSILGESGALVDLPIEDSPHYKFLVGNSLEYRNYWNRFCGIQLVEDHSPNTFRKLAEDFDYLCDPYESRYIRVVKVAEGYKSFDGDHRLAILKSQGADIIKVEVAGGT